MFSRPPGKFPFTSSILHLYLNTAEHSFLHRDVMYLGRVSMLSAFLFDRMFVVFDLFWLSASRVCILLVWILVLSSSLCFNFSRVFKWSISTLCCMQVPIIFFSQIEFFIWLFNPLFSWLIRYLICFRSISCVMSAMAVSVLSAIPGVVSGVIRIVFRFLLLMLCICCFSWLFMIHASDP